MSTAVVAAVVVAGIDGAVVGSLALERQQQGIPGPWDLAVYTSCRLVEGFVVEVAAEVGDRRP